MLVQRVQRGRACSSAELDLEARGYANEYTLQWGRARAGAEFPLSLLVLLEWRKSDVASAPMVLIASRFSMSRTFHMTGLDSIASVMRAKTEISAPPHRSRFNYQGIG